MLLIVPQVASQVNKNLAEVATALGWSISNEGWNVSHRLRGETGAVIGGRVYSENVAKQMEWELLSNSADWLTLLPEEYTARKVSVLTVAQFRALNETKFVKQTDPFWWFKSQAYEPGTFSKYIPDDTKVLVSDVLRYTSKYRAFVKDRKVIASCCYWLHTRQMEIAKQTAEYNLPKNYTNNCDDVVRFIDTVLRDDRVPCVKACAIDAVRYDKDKYAILKSKPAHSANPYGCELVAALDAIKSSCIPRKN